MLRKIKFFLPSPPLPFNILYINKLMLIVWLTRRYANLGAHLKTIAAVYFGKLKKFRDTKK